MKYLIIAIIIHLIMGMIFAIWVILPASTGQVLFKGKISRKSTEPPKVQPKKQKEVLSKIPATILPRSAKVKERIVVKEAVKAPAPYVVKDLPQIRPKDLELAKRPDINIERVIGDAKGERDREVAAFGQKFGISGRGKAIKAIFTPVIARYADGDWHINPTAIPNLMLEITRRTNVKAEFKPITVNVDSPDIVKSPFVYFTGTRDFHLTETEVENLRKYLLQGGAVYADNSLPGRRSRFDMAFRREMARVLPQYPLKPISPSHPIFNSLYQIKEITVGMNWRCDPIEVIEIHGRTAVIYTLNDYGDLWETRFSKNGGVDTSLDQSWQSVTGPHWEQWEYENVNKESIEQAYQLGVNIISYLLMELKK